MKILLPDIPEEGIDLDFEEKIENGSLGLLSPVKATLRVEKAGPEIIVKGEIRAAVGLQCSRCTKSFSEDIVVGIETVYHPLEELTAEEKHEIKEDELNLGFYKGEELDISDLITEQVFLNVPMKPLCSELCKGICPKCGTDLNSGTCKCEIKEIDPRFETLKHLLNKGKE
jgi:uncharacterized protein